MFVATVEKKLSEIVADAVAALTVPCAVHTAIAAAATMPPMASARDGNRRSGMRSILTSVTAASIGAGTYPGFHATCLAKAMLP